MKTVDFSETIAASDLKGSRSRHLIEFIRYVSIEGQGHFFTVYFQVLYLLCFTRPRYKVRVYRTIGPLVGLFNIKRPAGVHCNRCVSSPICPSVCPSVSSE